MSVGKCPPSLIIVYLPIRFYYKTNKQNVIKSYALSYVVRFKGIWHHQVARNGINIITEKNVS